MKTKKKHKEIILSVQKTPRIPFVYARFPPSVCYLKFLGQNQYPFLQNHCNAKLATQIHLQVQSALLHNN